MSLKQRKINSNRGCNQTTTYAVFELIIYALYLPQSFHFPQHFLHHFYLFPQRRRNGTTDCYWTHHVKALEKWTNSTKEINGGLQVKWEIKCRLIRFFFHSFKKHIGKKDIDEFSSKWGMQLCSVASYQVARYRLRDNRVRENTNSWEPGTGYIWGGRFIIVTGCHVRSASLVCHDVRKSCSRRYHKEFIFLCDLKKIVFNHSFQNVTASSHEEAAW